MSTLTMVHSIQNVTFYVCLLHRRSTKAERKVRRYADSDATMGPGKEGPVDGKEGTVWTE